MLICQYSACRWARWMMIRASAHRCMFMLRTKLRGSPSPMICLSLPSFQNDPRDKDGSRVDSRIAVARLTSSSLKDPVQNDVPYTTQALREDLLRVRNAWEE